MNKAGWEEEMPHMALKIKYKRKLIARPLLRKATVAERGYGKRSV